MKKEKVLVSACLLGTDCKYNGGNNKNEKVIEFLKDKEVVPICPEQLGGLPTPRTPSEIRNEKVYTKDDRDVTKEFKLGAEKVLKIAKEESIKKALLKESSPSCGVNKIYDGSFNNTKIKGMGITARLLKENGITIMSEDDIK